VPLCPALTGGACGAPAGQLVSTLLENSTLHCVKDIKKFLVESELQQFFTETVGSMPRSF
jgi:hypothetical protein